MFQIGDNIVYPMHGAGIIEAIEEKEFSGKKQQKNSQEKNNSILS
ncbi:CarD family transcriptional regulator, partial [Bacillus sp. YAF12_1]